MDHEGLNAKQQQLVTVAAFTAKGDVHDLRTALNDALEAGWSIGEIKEVLVEMYAYAGFPRSLNGINALMDVLAERKQRGIRDAEGREPSAIPANQSSIEVGTAIRDSLTGGQAPGRYAAFCPVIETFLKGHLFGGIFGRDNLRFGIRCSSSGNSSGCSRK